MFRARLDRRGVLARRGLVICVIGVVVLGLSAASGATTPNFEEVRQRALDQLDKLNEAEKLYVGLRQKESLPSLNIEEMKDMTWGTRNDPVRVLQVIGPDSARVKYGDYEWLWRGSTKGWADDVLVRTGTCIIFVHGTETFTTVLGSTRTLRVLNAMDGESVTEVLALTELLRRAHSFEKIGEASFVEVKSGMVALMLPDGTKKLVRLSDLAPGDRKWVDEFNAKELAKQRDLEKQKRAAIRSGKR
jgi:hypothetical protein